RISANLSRLVALFFCSTLFELVALGRLQQLPGVSHDFIHRRVGPLDSDDAASVRTTQREAVIQPSDSPRPCHVARDHTFVYAEPLGEQLLAAMRKVAVR